MDYPKLNSGKAEMWGLEEGLNLKNLFYTRLMPRWTKEEEAHLTKKYKQQHTDWQDLLSHVNHNKEAVIIRASIKGLSKKQTNWTKEEIEQLKVAYKDKKVSELSQKVNRTKNAIRKILSDNKVRKEICWHKHRINAQFFSEWTEESSYVLGLIASDGCINDRKKHYSVEITSKDKSLLESVRKLMNFTKKVEKSRGTYRIRIDNKLVYNDIVSKGISHRKSKTIDFPDVPEKNINHFIRGFFDGDGSIYKLKDGRIVAKFTCWSPKFLEKLQKIISTHCNVREKKIHDHSIVYYPKECFKVLNFIYKKSMSETRLNRKYNRYLSFCGGDLKCAA